MTMDCKVLWSRFRRRNILLVLILFCIIASMCFAKYNQNYKSSLLHFKSRTNVSISNSCECQRNVESRFLHKNFTSTCSEDAENLGFGQKVFSFTFFDHESKKESSFDRFGRDYLSGLKENIEGIKRSFPGWRVRLYTELSNTLGSMKDLCRLDCEEEILDICYIERNPKFGDLSSLYPLIWRFLPILDDQVSAVFVRDLDSLITQREVSAINAFLESDKDVHIMRDHPLHDVPMLGGTWGAKLDRPLVRELFRKAFDDITKSNYASAPRSERGADQSALKVYIWPWAKKISLSHDSYRCLQFSGTQSFPTQRVEGVGNFVGSVIKMNNMIPLIKGYECPYKCRPKDHKDWTFC